MNGAFLLKKISFSTLFLGLCALVVLGGCSSRENLPPEAEGKVLVVATIFPLADWTRNIGGDRVYVSTLLPLGASPHTFDPTPKEMRLLSNAKLFLRAGLKMDDWGGRLGRTAQQKGMKSVALGDRLLALGTLHDVSDITSDAVTLMEHDHDHDHHDGHHHHHDHDGVNPHFWLDPQLAVESVKIIRDTLVEVDPDGAADYKKNADEYIAKLEQLNQDMTAELQGHEGKGFISFHNAYPYLAYRYKLTIAAVIEEYAGKTPSEKYIRDVADLLQEKNIKTIFSEPQLNPHVAEILAKEVKGKVGLLDPYGAENEKDRSSYIELIKFNVSALKSSFE